MYLEGRQFKKFGDLDGGCNLPQKGSATFRQTRKYQKDNQNEKEQVRKYDTHGIAILIKSPNTRLSYTALTYRESNLETKNSFAFRAIALFHKQGTGGTICN